MSYNCILGLADQTAGFNLSHDSAVAENPKRDVLYFYLLKKERSIQPSELGFYELLKEEHASLLRRYLKQNRLSASDEYQLIVTLAMEWEDELLCEQIICSYIRRYGLCLKAKKALEDLGFEQALKTLKSQHLETEKIFDLCNGKISIHQKLKDGFEMMQDDEILSI